MRLALTLAGLTLATTLTGCDNTTEKAREVRASAYTLSEAETKKGNVGLAAWGDQLKPGMKAIAVSRDLIQAGLTHNTEVTIEGLPGTYTVLDKMNKRWTDHIDILMADRQDARDWGRQDVTIRWEVPAE
ncbi:lipoprotein [Alcanivorax hongdengensis A-11-3]|uniref:Lipoprotein n=1 Tax=Alcanivorax hongdengensis A-11-3 TaxID=1177179 RepID=L0WFX1_9GAMM|nr:3D domain-containing protein [Alcanivorax hongdengensis]EKF74725.1 lipoprotein [Alcanivorax hongdengensis A-11-3]